MKARLYKKETQKHPARMTMLRFVNLDRVRRRLRALLRSDEENLRRCWEAPRRLEEIGEGSMGCEYETRPLGNPVSYSSI